MLCVQRVFVIISRFHRECGLPALSCTLLWFQYLTLFLSLLFFAFLLACHVFSCSFRFIFSLLPSPLLLPFHSTPFGLQHAQVFEPPLLDQPLVCRQLSHCLLLGPVNGDYYLQRACAWGARCQRLNRPWLTLTYLTSGSELS